MIQMHKVDAIWEIRNLEFRITLGKQNCVVLIIFPKLIEISSKF